MPKYILLIGGVPYSTSNPTSYVEAEDGINKIIRNREKIEGKDVGNLYEFHNKSPENLKETKGYWKCKYRNLEGSNPSLEIRTLLTVETEDDLTELIAPKNEVEPYYETYGEDLIKIINAAQTHPNRVVTISEGDDGELYATLGMYHVNRLHYYILDKDVEDFNIKWS